MPDLDVESQCGMWTLDTSWLRYVCALNLRHFENFCALLSVVATAKCRVCMGQGRLFLPGVPDRNAL